MIHDWFNAKSNKKSVRAQNHNAATSKSREFGFEKLEDKICLAFLGFFDGVTLDINQTADDGDVVVENSTGVWRATDNAGTFTFVNSTNVSVNLLNNTANRLDFYVETEHLGDVTLNLGSGPRDVFFPGELVAGIEDITNVIGGDLEITGTSNTQEINLSPNPDWPLIVRGSLTADLGQGFDFVRNNESSVTVDVDVSLTGVNLFRYSSGPLLVGGDVFMDTSNEEVESFLLELNSGSQILGDFTYIGGDDIDHVDLNGTTIIGNVDIDLGIGNPFFGDAQNVTITGLVLLGDVNIVAGDSNLGNEINLLGAFGGNIVSYTGGDLVDIVTYTFDGTQADVFAVMGGGDDIFELNLPVNLLEIDFGNDLGDMFINNVGPFDFEFDITNFHFFDHFYTALDDTLVMNQLADTGDILIDNDGGISGFAWRMFPAIGGFSSTVPAENLVLNMLPNTGNNIEMDLFNPVIASITMNLGDGARDIQFTGIANNPLRDIKITAGAGSQNVDLSVNSPLGVATLDIDLGTGFDTVDDNANSLIIDEDLRFTGVNHFEHDGLLSVFRNTFIDTSGEVEDTLFASNGSFFSRQFSYVGGGGADDLRLNGVGGATITQQALIDLGDSTGGDQFILLDSPDTSFGQNLTVISTNASSNDVFTTDPGTQFLGNLSIDLGGGPNQATIVGVLGGNTVNYTGGSGVDNVIYGLTGGPGTLTASLGAGADTFNLQAVANIAGTLIIDFGTGADTFTNGYGPFDFNAELYGLFGFNHIYNFVAGSLVSTQVQDFGFTITVDNNGPSASIRFIDGGTTVLGPVNDLSVTMLDNSIGDLNVNFDNALAGNLALNLGDGTRALNLGGTDNSIGGNLTITGGDGAQTVEVAVNNALTVGGNALFDLGLGFDPVDEDANDISIGGNLDMLGVNDFENNGVMFVGGAVTVDSSFETETGRFDDDNTMTIIGNFTYTGGAGSDEITLNGAVGGTSIDGDVFIDVGDNMGGASHNIFLNQPTTSIGGSLTIVSTGAANPDVFLSDVNASYGGDINIDLGDGINSANIVGITTGSNVTYNGGSGVDNVSFATTGNPVDVIVNLGAGDDTFSLLPNASIDPTTLTVDFGGGADTFNNLYGAFDFNAELLNLNAFDHVYDLASNTLTSTQVSASGPVTIDDNGTAGAIRFIDGGTSELTPVDNLTVHLLDGPGTDLNVTLNNGLAGDLTLNLGDGNRALNLDGTDNSIGRDLTITGGSGAQTVEIAVNNALTVGGNAVFDLGTGDDTVDEDANDISIGGNLEFWGVNDFENNGVMFVGGHALVDSSSETEAGRFDDDNTMTIIGNFTYRGGAGNDEVTLNGAVGGTTIGGNALIDVGDNTLAASQNIFLNQPTTSIGGSLTIISTGSANPDVFLSDVSASYGADINIDLGNGINSANIVGILGGANVDYTGGNGVDNVSFGTTGNPADVNIKLGGGDDTFTLLGGSAISPTLRVDFGGGDDTFNNLFGAFTFDTNLLNWHGYNRFYRVATDMLNIVQVADTGDVTLDNNGAGGAIRLLNGSVTEMTPAANVRLNLMPFSSTNVNVDYDSPQTGYTLIDMKNSGNREVMFVGDSNQIGGFLRIEAGNGGASQNVTLAVNADLIVGEALVINLRDGLDTVDDGAHDVTVGTNMILRAVNNFVLDNTLTTGGNLTVNTTFDNRSSLLENNGVMLVGNRLNYLGGTADDDVLVGGAIVASNINVEFGINTVAGETQVADFRGITAARLRVSGGSSLGSNQVLTDAATTIAGDVIVNFSAATTVNDVTLLGNYGGTYGTYRGGSAVDTVSFGANANNMHFVTRLGNSNDIFELKAGTSLLSSLLDFGPGNDTFIDEIGQPYPFPLTILNLP